MTKTRFGTLGLILGATLPLAALQTAQAQPYGGYGYGYGSTQTAVPAGNPSASEEASVTIWTPKDGAAVPAADKFQLSYKVSPGPKGDHVHLYVDGREVAVLRDLDGTYGVGPLNTGRHELAIKVVNRSHVPIGVESSVSVTVQ